MCSRCRAGSVAMSVVMTDGQSATTPRVPSRLSADWSQLAPPTRIFPGRARCRESSAHQATPAISTGLWIVLRCVLDIVGVVGFEFEQREDGLELRPHGKGGRQLHRIGFGLLWNRQRFGRLLWNGQRFGRLLRKAEGFRQLL